MTKHRVVFVCCVAMLVGSGVAHAVKPISFSGSAGGEAPIGYCADQGFEVWENVTWEFKGKAFFDKDGNLVRIQRHWKVEGWVYNYDDPEQFLEYKNMVYNEVWDPESGETRYTGLWALITLPGYGSIFIDVGLVLLDENFNVIYEAGQHQWWNANVDELCEHLTP